MDEIVLNKQGRTIDNRVEGKGLETALLRVPIRVSLVLKFIASTLIST